MTHPVCGDAQLGGDDRRGPRMIAGDHDRPDAGAASRGPRLPSLPAAGGRSCRSARGRPGRARCARRARRPARHPSGRTGRPPPACAAPRRPARRSSVRISARRSGVSGRVSSPTSSCRTARQQDVRRALGEGEQALLPLGIRVDRAHQLALGGERHLRHAHEARVERLVVQPGLPRRDDQRALGRIALHGPAALVLLEDGVVGPVGGGQRAHELDPQRARRWRRRRPAARRPRGSYPVPPKPTRPLAVTTARTVISFLVSVPVLSEAMTVAEPSVSTAARWRTMAFRLRHALHAEREDGGDHRRQALRHRRHRQRHAQDQDVEQRREAASRPPRGGSSRSSRPR